MNPFFPRRDKLQRLELTYTRLMRKSYHNATFNKDESDRAMERAQQVLNQIQGILHTMTTA